MSQTLLWIFHHESFQKGQVFCFLMSDITSINVTFNKSYITSMFYYSQLALYMYQSSLHSQSFLTQFVSSKTTLICSNVGGTELALLLLSRVHFFVCQILRIVPIFYKISHWTSQLWIVSYLGYYVLCMK